jgi:hypothetical protein
VLACTAGNRDNLNRDGRSPSFYEWRNGWMLRRSGDAESRDST